MMILRNKLFISELEFDTLKGLLLNSLLADLGGSRAEVSITGSLQVHTGQAKLNTAKYVQGGHIGINSVAC